MAEPAGFIDDFMLGAGSLLRGFSILASEPRVRGVAFAQAALTAVTVIAAAVAWFFAAPALADRLWTLEGAWRVAWIVVVYVVGFATTALSLPKLLGLPFNRAIVARADLALRGRPPTAEDTGIVRALFDEVLKLAILLAGLAVLAVIWVVGFCGLPLYPPLAWAWTATWVFFDYLDYPVGLHGGGWKELRALARPGLVAGFGGPASLLLLVPVVNFLVVPAAVAGAAALHAKLKP
jgi:CysZ protein